MINRRESVHIVDVEEIYGYTQSEGNRILSGTTYNGFYEISTIVYMANSLTLIDASVVSYNENINESESSNRPQDERIDDLLKRLFSLFFDEQFYYARYDTSYLDSNKGYGGYNLKKPEQDTRLPKKDFDENDNKERINIKFQKSHPMTDDEKSEIATQLRVSRLIVNQFHLALCKQDDKYKEEIATLHQGSKMLVSAVTGYVAATINIEAAVNSAVASAMLFLIGKMGINAFCEFYSQNISE